MRPIRDTIALDEARRLIAEDYEDAETAPLKVCAARILEMGCSVGHSTVAIAQAFPDAEIHAVLIPAHHPAQEHVDPFGGGTA